LAVAADVFIYLREIGPVLREAARVLVPGGLFALTVQAHPGERGAVLGADGRYAHGVASLREDAGAAGLAVALLEPAEIRRQNGVGVPGWLAVLAR
ncbi:methyltransferase type 12, partial [Methylobacterium tarhaniae]